MNTVSSNGWVGRTDITTEAEEFSQLLAANCVWSLDDFDKSGYPWEGEVPPRAQWDQEIDDLNAHLESLSRQ